VTVNWTGKRVLVTGADGFIGSHLTEALVRAGADVTALALYNSFDSHGWLDDMDDALRSDVRMVRGDVRDAAQMRTIADGQEYVFHLAALISIPYSYEAPSSYIDTNVHGTANILQAAQAGGARCIVHTSTSEVYGTAQFTPISEDHPLQPQSPYAASKVAADAIAASFARSFDTPVITLRPFNTFGPRQSERAVISAIIRQALDPACAEIRLGNLAPKRAFNFVTDTAAAFMAIAGLADKHPGTDFNAGVKDMISIGDLATRIVRLTGCGKAVTQEAQRLRPEASEVMALIADSARLGEAAGWKPQVTLDEGLAQTIEWWRTRLGRVRPNADYIT
jgi:NAD dependent epimerase/dehydratase